MKQYEHVLGVMVYGSWSSIKMGVLFQGDLKPYERIDEHPEIWVC